MDINQIFGEDYFPQLDNDFLRLFKDKKKSDNCIKRKVSFDDNITDISLKKNNISNKRIKNFRSVNDYDFQKFKVGDIYYTLKENNYFDFDIENYTFMAISDGNIHHCSIVINLIEFFIKNNFIEFKDKDKEQFVLNIYNFVKENLDEKYLNRIEDYLTSVLIVIKDFEKKEVIFANYGEVIGILLRPNLEGEYELIYQTNNQLKNKEYKRNPQIKKIELKSDDLILLSTIGLREKYSFESKEIIDNRSIKKIIDDINEYNKIFDSRHFSDFLLNLPIYLINSIRKEIIKSYCDSNGYTYENHYLDMVIDNCCEIIIIINSKNITSKSIEKS